MYKRNTDETGSKGFRTHADDIGETSKDFRAHADNIWKTSNGFRTHADDARETSKGFRTRHEASVKSVVFYYKPVDE